MAKTERESQETDQGATWFRFEGLAQTFVPWFLSIFFFRSFWFTTSALSKEARESLGVLKVQKRSNTTRMRRYGAFFYAMRWLVYFLKARVCSSRLLQCTFKVLPPDCRGCGSPPTQARCRSNLIYKEKTPKADRRDACLFWALQA